MTILSMFFVNFCILIAFTYFGSLTYSGMIRSTLRLHLLRGGISIAAGLALMAYSVTVLPGVRFDYRYVPVAIAGLVGGPVAALGVALPLMAYRLSIGGVGAHAGVVGLFICALMASAFSARFRQRQLTVLQTEWWLPFLLFSVVNLSVLLVPGQGLHLLKVAYLPVVVLESAGLLLAFGVLQTRFRAVSLTRDYERLAFRDALTGALNRRAFDRDLELLVQEEAATYLMLLDIDHFKRINDEQGHAVGDRVLVKLSQLLHESVRGLDQVYRIGGEEFAVLLHGTYPRGAARVAERVRTEIQTQAGRRSGLDTVQLTVSAGLVLVSRDAATTLSAADALLYQAKRSGRNRTEHQLFSPAPRQSHASPHGPWIGQETRLTAGRGEAGQDTRRASYVPDNHSV